MIKCNEKTFEDGNLIFPLYVKCTFISSLLPKFVFFPVYFDDLRRLFEPVEVTTNWSPPMNDKRFNFGLGTMAEEQNEEQ